MQNRTTLSGIAVGMAVVFAAGLGITVFAAEGGKAPVKREGYTDTPMELYGKWHIHDSTRPNPPVVTPGTCSTQDQPGKAPSDAIVLFDGKDLSHWVSRGKGGTTGPCKWVVKDGYMSSPTKTGDIYSKETFGDAQIHVEWCEPTTNTGRGQGRGNSGIYVMSLYEVQVLDSYHNETYADGQAGAIYGQYPPMVNAVRPEGQWQSYDIIFTAPRFDANHKLVKPAYETVLLNGVLIQNHQKIFGPTMYKRVPKYRYHEAKMPLKLQYHHNEVRFRNIWVRPLKPRIDGMDPLVEATKVPGVVSPAAKPAGK